MTTYDLPPFTKNLIDDADADNLYVLETLEDELATPRLDRLGHRLFWVSTRSWTNIDPLHQQLVKGREIIASEDADLHLVWNDAVIYVKPIPAYLFHRDFWRTQLLPSTTLPTGTTHGFHLDSLSNTCRRALGLVRSYSRLIRYRSDLQLAKNAHLLPEEIGFAELQAFLAGFANLPEEVVAARYHYGQMRVSRLNWAVRFSQYKLESGRLQWWYHKSHWRTGQYIRRLVGPAIFVFAALSLLLSAMQVVLAAQASEENPSFESVSYGFSVAVICLIPALVLGLGIGVGYILGMQWLFTSRMLRKVKAEKRSRLQDS